LTLRAKGARLGGWLELTVDWVVGQIAYWGYPGIFALMAIESSFIPFPSEVVPIPAGYLASQGEMDPALATGAGVLGSLAGALFNYGLALWLGRAFVERLLHYLPGGERQLAGSERFFAQHGEITIFVGRLIPAIRQLISLPAGLARMNLARFVTYTAIGAGLWSAILVAIGWWAGVNEEVWRPLLRQATLWVILGATGLVAVYVYVHHRAGRLA
jgi:membrane protein DedA with SNARE-associated domain